MFRDRDKECSITGFIWCGTKSSGVLLINVGFLQKYYAFCYLTPRTDLGKGDKKHYI